MNYDLYTTEFRNFKYLKSSPALLNYINASSKIKNSVQPFSDINDPNFSWPCRVEFLEQLVDLSLDTIYIVEAGELHNDHKASRQFIIGEATVHTIDDPTTWIGNVAQPYKGLIVTESDIPRIEEFFGKDCYMCSGEHWTDCQSNNWTDTTKITHVFHVKDILFQDPPDYTAIFYDRLAAENYRRAITLFLKNNYDAVSAFTRLI